MTQRTEYKSYARSAPGTRAEEALYEQAATASNGDAPKKTWRDFLHTVEELPEGSPEWIAEDFMPEGVALFGAYSGAGKTWLALSLSKAVLTGERFLGVFNVPKKYPVIYLCPEMGAKAFRQRCEKLGIGGEQFYCTTIRDGMPLNLFSETLQKAIQELGPCVIVLDTAIRFNPSKDENSASENRSLANAVFNLITLGAVAVIALHHATKASTKETMTLENVLRGTGDFGAMADVVWGIQQTSKKTGQCAVECVKARDFEPRYWKFHVQLRPYIDRDGKIVMLEQDSRSDDEKIDEALTANPRMSKSELAKRLDVARKTAESKAFAARWTWVPDSEDSKTGIWKRIDC